jgi:hypothetical protein
MLGQKLLFKFIIDLGYYFKTLYLHMVTDLLKDNMSHKHI